MHKRKGMIMTGKLKWFNNNKGYGFIAGDDGNDYFVHASNLEPGTYYNNDELTFELADGRKGIKAVNVKLA